MDSILPMMSEWVGLDSYLKTVSGALKMVPKVSGIELILQDGSRLIGTPGSEPEADIVVGRSSDSGIRLEGDSISRQHASLRSDTSGRWFVRDLGSRGGTSLNWIRLDESEEPRVRTGDRLRFGDTNVVVDLPGGDGQDGEKEQNFRIEATAETRQDEFRTRGSLLLRLNASGTMEREIGWTDFYDRYVPLIKGFAQRAGAKAEEAEDVAHEVIANFFRAAHRFQYDASAGRFRGYLKAATLNAMRARWRKRKGQVNVEDESSLPAADSNELDAVWDQEWTRSVIDRAIVAVRMNGKQSEQSWEAFDLFGRRGVPISEISSRLGMTPEAIRQAKSRISRQIRGEIERIRSEEG
jgi:RNA polymerase sigma-70 factor (ECF subfamily)